MITLGSLIEEAQRLGLPVDKKRAILREYLQVLMLNTVYKHKLGNKMYFMGGTALRFFYKIPRFSEDLDFNAKNMASAEFDSLLGVLATSMNNEGFKVDVTRDDIYSVYSAKVNFISIMRDFGLVDKRGGDIMIKIEANNPEWKSEHEPLALSAFGLLFTALLMTKGSLLAEKSHALIHRCRGRDVYDVLYMLRLKFPLDKRMFLAKNIGDNPKEALLNKFRSLEKGQLEKLSNQLAPFLFKEGDVELVKNAIFYGQELLKDYE